jgi:hypothetical protein
MEGNRTILLKQICAKEQTILVSADLQRESTTGHNLPPASAGALNGAFAGVCLSPLIN